MATPSARRLAARASIPPFYVMEVMQAAADREAAGRDVLHLEVGQPSTPAPNSAIRAATRALESDVLGYTTALGLAPLRERIARWYFERYDVSVNPGRIVVTTGASGSCVLAFLALFDPGDRVGVAEPGYPCYRNDLITFGIEAVGIPVDATSDFRLTINHLERAGPLDGLVIASPSNPTGTVLRADDLEAILTWAAEHDIPVIVDEIYQGIEYGPRVPTALEWATANDADNVLVFNSFSKYFSMTGWRLGWIVAPDHLVTPLERLGQNLTIAAPTLSQLAGVAAFDGLEECEENVRRYARNRQALIDGLPRAGLGRFAPPDGGFYFWIDVSDLLTETTPDSMALCAHWLDRLGVAATPGVDFDPRRGDRFVRLSYSGSEATIDEAVSRLTTWYEE